MTFLVCSRSETVLSDGCRLGHSYTYGTYTKIGPALQRIKEVVENSHRYRDEEISYYINELAPRNVYPLVSKTYSYEECLKLIAQN